MTVKFNPQTGMEVSTAEEIREEVKAMWIDAFKQDGLPPLNVSEGKPATQVIDGQTESIYESDSQVVYLANQFNPRTASGIWQDALAYIYFLTRKRGEPTIVTCQCSGLVNTVVPYGAIVQDTSGNQLICNSALTIGSTGISETTFRCVTTGAIEIPPNTVTKIITAIPGWDAVNNQAAGAIGRDLETRAEFEQRRVQSVAKNGHGTVQAIEGQIANINGVLDVRVLENQSNETVTKFGIVMTGHSICAIVYGGEDSDIAQAIYQKKDGGCDTIGNTDIQYLYQKDNFNVTYNYRIYRPSPTNFNVKIVYKQSDTLTPEVQDNVINAVVNDFNGTNIASGNTRVTTASDILASRFYIAVMGAAPGENLVSIEISLGDSQDYKDVVSVLGTQEPVISSETVHIVIEG